MPYQRPTRIRGFTAESNKAIKDYELEKKKKKKKKKKKTRVIIEMPE